MTDTRRFEVEHFAFIGRTFEEYRRMFDLDPETLTDETILDCPAGPGSFVATARERGIAATGVDVMYDRGPGELARHCRDEYRAAAEQLLEKRDLFSWEFYGSVEERKRFLRRAYERFLEDYPEGRWRGRYVHAELPKLQFADDSFSLVLSAHFLFLYADRLTYDFHGRTLRELARVAEDEVRVFPLVGLDTEPYGRLADLRGDLKDAGYGTEIREVPFEFQRGATEMLVVSV